MLWGLRTGVLPPETSHFRGELIIRAGFKGQPPFSCERKGPAGVMEAGPPPLRRLPALGEGGGTNCCTFWLLNKQEPPASLKDGLS